MTFSRNGYLVLSTERLDVQGAVQVIQAFLRTERFQPTPASLAEVKDLSLTARANAALLVNPITRELQLFFACKNGHLSISGRVAQENQRRVAASRGSPGC